MGSFAYTHFQIPNSEEPDLMLFESGRKNCVDLPGMPCAEDGQANRFYAFRAAARSRHPGGVHVAYADERVEWVSDTIDLDTWRRKGSLAEKRLDEDDDDVEFKVRISDRF
jgi:prepilin-type processing-associated H-X9-DG protein